MSDAQCPGCGVDIGSAPTQPWCADCTATVHSIVRDLRRRHDEATARYWHFKGEAQRASAECARIAAAARLCEPVAEPREDHP